MKRFVEGVERTQTTLFPECHEDWVNKDNPVRLIDVFDDELDLGGLGFSGIDTKTARRIFNTVRIFKRLWISTAILICLNVYGGITVLAETGRSMQMRNIETGYILKITGSNATVIYSGECWVRQSDEGEQRVVVGGTVPHLRELKGHGLRCDIVQESAEGSLTVEIVNKKGGSRTRSRIQGAGSRLRIQLR